MVERTLQERRRQRSHNQPYHHPTPRAPCSINLTTIGIVLIGIQLILLYIGFRLQQTHYYFSNTPHADTKAATNTAIPPPRLADGTFSGYSVYYQNVTSPAYTVSHCVGENYQSDLSWMHRSCHFSFVCFDVQTKEFQIYRHEQEDFMTPYLKRRPLTDVSQSYMGHPSNNNNNNNNSRRLFVSLGGINRKWGMGSMDKKKNNNNDDDGVNRLKWFPTILSRAPTSFYALPATVVMVPFHSLAGGNPGHLVWDDFTPIYTLLEMFQLPVHHPLLIRYTLPGPGLWASCDATPLKTLECAHMFDKFWPLWAGHNATTTTSYKSTTVTTQWDATLQLSSLVNNKNTRTEPKSNLICARHGVAGIGALTDHGTDKLHGWHERDYTITHNHGRGGMFWKFRQHVLRNMEIISRREGEDEGAFTNHHHNSFSAPYKIVISVQSSSNPLRNLDFTQQTQALHRYYWNASQVEIQEYVFKDYSLQEQLKIANEASIFITGAGGGAVTSMFVSQGASILIYFNEVGGRESNVPTNLPARLDWDFFNSMAYARVHWLPSQTMNEMTDIEALLKLVQHELGIIQREYS
jgi:hypothetical protein